MEIRFYQPPLSLKNVFHPQPVSFFVHNIFILYPDIENVFQPPSSLKFVILSSAKFIFLIIEQLKGIYLHSP